MKKGYTTVPYLCARQRARALPGEVRSSEADTAGRGSREGGQGRPGAGRLAQAGCGLVLTPCAASERAGAAVCQARWRPSAGLASSGTDKRGLRGSSFWAILRSAQRLEGGGERTARSCERAARWSPQVTEAFWQRFRKWGGPVGEFRKLSELG